MFRYDDNLDDISSETMNRIKYMFYYSMNTNDLMHILDFKM